MLKEGSYDGIQFATVNLTGKCNEDRSWNYLSVPEEDISEVTKAISSFAVFDGHSGKYAAEHCEKHMYSLIIQKFTTLVSAFMEIDKNKLNMNGVDMRDGVYIQALHSAIEETHKYIATQDKAGCTMVGLHLFKEFNPELNTGSSSDYRVLCNNIGDSRCIMVYGTRTSEPLEDSSSHHFFSPQKKVVIPSGKSLPPKPTQPRSSSLHGWSGESVRTSTNHSYDDYDDLQSQTMERTCKIQIGMKAMSEDHNFECGRERRRILEKISISGCTLPIDLDYVVDGVNDTYDKVKSTLATAYIGPDTMDAIKELYVDLTKGNPSVKDQQFLGMYKSLEFKKEKESRLSMKAPELVYEASSKLMPSKDSEHLIRCLAAQHLLDSLLKRMNGAESPNAGTWVEVGSEEGVDPAFDPVREESFIDHRYSTDGTVRGPLAYHGRYNSSLLMTRSIGDRFGPRGCLPLSDVTAVTVSSTQHARFVLASDGMWDVLSNESVRKLALYYLYKDPKDLAIHLALKAQKKRKALAMRPDDITVTVVDVNPENSLFIKTHKNSPNTSYTGIKVKTEKSSEKLFGTLERSTSGDKDKDYSVSVRPAENFNLNANANAGIKVSSIDQEKCTIH